MSNGKIPASIPGSTHKLADGTATERFWTKSYVIGRRLLQRRWQTGHASCRVWEAGFGLHA